MLRFLASTAAVALISTAAVAADLPDLPLPPQEVVVQQYHFWAEASVLIMRRNFTDDFSVASSAAGGGPGTGDVFDSDDFEPDEWEPGFEAALGFGNGRWGIEGRGFWLNEFTESASVDGPIAGLTIDTDPPTGYGCGAACTLTGTFTSNIHGAEGSVSFSPVPNGTIYVGPRWIELDESFELFGDFGAANETNTWDVNNQLLGGQIGVRTDLISLMSGTPGAFSLNTDVSVGVFNNDVDLDFETLDTGVSRYGVISDSDSLLAVAVDASLTAGYNVTQNFGIFAGYNVLWIDGVATAVEQIKGTGAYGGPPPLDVQEGSVLYHGAKAGATFRF